MISAGINTYLFSWNFSSMISFICHRNWFQSLEIFVIKNPQTTINKALSTIHLSTNHFLSPSNTGKNSDIFFFLPLLLSLITLGLIGYLYYKTTVKKVTIDDKTQSDEPLNEEIIHISKETEQHLLEQLKRFEITKGYLDENITQKSLANDFNTNSKYLSKIIRDQKELKFNNYLKKLRVEYAINRLETDSIFREYTVEAIAKESGFKNKNKLTEAFKTFYNTTPHEFIKKINKS